MGDFEDRKAAFEKRRSERNARVKAMREEQELTDREAIFELEEQHGSHQIATAVIPFKEGRPMVLAVRCPTAPEMKRYRAMQKNLNKKGHIDLDATVKANEALATATLVYPDAETYAEIREELPNVHAQLGVAASNLASAEAEEEGKD